MSNDGQPNWPSSGVTAPAAGPSPGGAQFWDSGLTTPDFAACLSMGLRPIRLVQGYFFGQISSWSSYSAYPLHYYPCACTEMGPHNTGWLGQVNDLDAAWVSAHQTALGRMLEEAANLGAHGIVGVHTDMGHPTNEQSCEVHLYGTAVSVEGARAPQHPWATQLAGHKLAKLIESGFVPSTVAYTRCTAMMAEGCNMEVYGSGRCPTGYLIKPLQETHELARSGAIDAARQVAGGGSMYDVRMAVHEAERYGATYVTCSLLGSVVRAVRPTLPIATPVATVNLGQ